MLHELERMVLVLVGDGLEEEAVQALLEREVDHGLDWVQAALARDLGHRPMRPLHRVEDEDPLVRGRPRLRPDRATLPALARGPDQAAAHLGVGPVLALLLDRPGPELLPRREPVERQVGFERGAHAERAYVTLRAHSTVGTRRLLT